MGGVRLNALGVHRDVLGVLCSGKEWWSLTEIDHMTGWPKDKVEDACNDMAYRESWVMFDLTEGGVKMARATRRGRDMAEEYGLIEMRDLVAELRELAEGGASWSRHTSEYHEARWRKVIALLDNTPGLIDLDYFQDKVGRYVDASWPRETILHATVALGEEVGELCRAVVKREHGTRGTVEEWTAEIPKEAADVLGVLLDIARREGFSLGKAFVEQNAVVEARDINHTPIGTT